MGIIINGQNDTIGPVDNSMSLLGTVSIGGTMTIEDFTNIDSVGLITARNGLNVTGGNVKIGTTTAGQSEADDLTIATSAHTGMTIRSGATSKGAVYFSDGTSGNNEYRGVLEYNHSDDHFRIFTAASERLRITSAGDIYIRKAESGATKGSAALEFYGTTSSSVDRDQAKIESSAWTTNTNAGNLDFYTQTTAGNNLSLRMRIDGTGNIGIGTDNPTSFGPTLQVSGTDPALLLQDTATAVDYFGINVQSGAVINWFDDSAYFAIGTASGLSGGAYSEKVRIDSSGRLQIGSTNQTSAYFTVTDGAQVTGAALNGNNNCATLDYYESTARLLGHNSSGGSVAFFTNPSGSGLVERLRITSAGDVGIGVADPDVYSLGGNNRFAAIKASAGYTVLNLVDSNNSGSYLQFGNPTVRRGSLHFDSASNFLVTINESGSGTNLTEKLRLDSNGRLTISGQGLKLNPNNSSLYTLDGSLSYYATNNAVYLNGAGTNGWLRLNAAGTENNQNAINIFGGGAGAHIDMRTNNAERVRITSAGKIGINQTSPAGQVHIKGNTDESANPSIILDDNGDTRRCYVTNTSGDLMLGGIDSGTVQSRFTIHENGNMYHQRLDSAGNMMYQFATYSSQTSGAASGNTYTEHMAFRGGSEGMRSGSFNMTIYGDGGDNYMPVLFIRHGYHPTNSSFGGQWFGEMWLNNAGSINPQNYNHTGYNNWATCSFKYRWDCAHWNAKPTMSIIEHYVNYGRTNIADLVISGTTSYFVIWLLPGIYRVTYSAWDGLNAWWTNNSNVGGALTHREGGGNTTRSVMAYSARDTRYDSNISWGTQGQT